MSQVANPPQVGVRRWAIGEAEPRQAPFPGGPAVRVVVGADAGGPLGVLEVTLPSGGAMPEHEHGDSAVLLAPLAGRFRLVEEGGAATEVEPGAVATIPVGLRVRLENAGDGEARTLVVLTPPDFAERLDTWPTEATAPRPGKETEAAEQTLAAALEREHREIDRGVETFLDESGDEQSRLASLAQAMEALRRHIYLEEEFLFPPLRNAGFVAPIFVMLREHGELWQTMDAIERELAGADAAGAPGRCKLLLAQLERHNSKEEPILYPHADDVLGAPASAELRAFLADGRMPDGWTCANA